MNLDLNISKPVQSADWIEGAAKALAVLESFSAERQRLNISQIAQRAGLTRAAARRHVLTLQALGYLEGEADVRTPSFWLTHRVLRLAGNYLASARLPRVTQPVLNRLAAQTGLALSVAVLDGQDVVIVARSGEHRVSGSALPYGVHLGARLAAFATSTGRVLLSDLSAGDLKQWMKLADTPRLTPHTTTDARRLKALINAAASQGFCEALEEHELGVCALAVPLHDGQRRMVAALNIVETAGVSQQSLRSKSMQQRYLPLMQAAAAELRLLL
jgi:IclR family transcriptional regulator, pca regulon regulatory protein